MTDPTELDRLKRRCSNQRRELKRLNTKLVNVLNAAKAPPYTVARVEIAHETAKLLRRAQLAEARVARLEAEREYSKRDPHPLGTPLDMVGEGENGKAAAR